MTITEAYEFGNKHDVFGQLRLRSPDSVKHYHKKWIEGIHFYKRPGGAKTGYNYNLTLIRHWIQCHENVNDPNHLRAIVAYQQSLNPRK